MTPKQNHTLSQSERQATLHELLQERLRLNIRHTFITILEEEVSNFIQAALYQLTTERKDYRNDYYERDKERIIKLLNAISILKSSLLF